MIISLADTKIILGLSDTTYDALLTLELPMIQDSIMAYIKNYFKQDLSYTSNTISFSVNSILDSSSSFVTSGLFSGDYIVQNSKYNDGFYTISTVTASTLTSVETLVTETAANDITITRVKFPKELGMIMAKMAGYSIKNKYGVRSESFSRYSVSYDASGNSNRSSYITGFPDSITGSLTKYRRLYDDR